MARTWIILAGLLGAGGVTLGAYHAHGLEKMLAGRSLDEVQIVKQLDNCEVAVRYQMVHALAIFGIGVLSLHGCRRLLGTAAVCMLLGVICFSGGLYFVVFDVAGALSVAKLHWAVVPIGGLLMIVGWLLTALAGFFVGRDSYSP